MSKIHEAVWPGAGLAENLQPKQTILLNEDRLPLMDPLATKEEFGFNDMHLLARAAVPVERTPKGRVGHAVLYFFQNVALEETDGLLAPPEDVWAGWHQKVVSYRQRSRPASYIIEKTDLDLLKSANKHPEKYSSEDIGGLYEVLDKPGAEIVIGRDYNAAFNLALSPKDLSNRDVLSSRRQIGVQAANGGIVAVRNMSKNNAVILNTGGVPAVRNFRR